MPETTEINHPAAQFRAIALRIRNEPHARDAIADGFELIAASIDEAHDLVAQASAEWDRSLNACQECGQPEPLDVAPLPVIDPLDLPDLGTDLPTLGTDSPDVPASVSTTTSQAA